MALEKVTREDVEKYVGETLINEYVESGYKDLDYKGLNKECRAPRKD